MTTNYNEHRVKQRLCHWECFNRYFTYHVPPSEIADSYLKSFLNDLDEKENDEINSFIGSFDDLSIFYDRVNSFFKENKENLTEDGVVKFFNESFNIIDINHIKIFNIAIETLKPLFSIAIEKDWQKIVSIFNNTKNLLTKIYFYYELKQDSEIHSTSLFGQIQTVFIDETLKEARQINIDFSEIKAAPLRYFYLRWFYLNKVPILSSIENYANVNKRCCYIIICYHLNDLNIPNFKFDPKKIDSLYARNGLKKIKKLIQQYIKTDLKSFLKIGDIKPPDSIITLIDGELEYRINYTRFFARIVNEINKYLKNKFDFLELEERLQKNNFILRKIEENKEIILSIEKTNSVTFKFKLDRLNEEVTFIGYKPPMPVERPEGTTTSLNLFKPEGDDAIAKDEILQIIQGWFNEQLGIEE